MQDRLPSVMVVSSILLHISAETAALRSVQVLLGLSRQEVHLDSGYIKPEHV